MFIILTILCVAGYIFCLKKIKENDSIAISTIKGLLLILIMFLFATDIGLYMAIRQNDSGYLDSQLETLPEANAHNIRKIEDVKFKLKDDPELANEVADYLQEKIAVNQKEIDRCQKMKARIGLYRFLLYFG